MTKQTLIDKIEQVIMTGDYSDNFAVYAATGDNNSPAREGQTQFDQGGVIDECVTLVGTYASIIDLAWDYCDGIDPRKQSTWSANEIARNVLDELRK